MDGFTQPRVNRVAPDKRPENDAKEIEVVAPQPQEYRYDNSPTLMILFDLRGPAAVPHLYHERAGWQGDSNTEALDQDYFILTVYAGGARRLAR